MNAVENNPRRDTGNSGKTLVGVLEAVVGNGVSPNLHGAGVTAPVALRLLINLMDSIPDRIYFKDLESRFVLVNKAKVDSCKMADSAALSGKTDFDFFSEEHARAALEDEKHVIATGQPIIGKEEKETWPDGRVTWCSSTKMPLHDEAGRIVGTFGISRDITERYLAQEALRESDQRYRELLSAIPTYTYSVQFEEGRPIHTNHSSGCQAVTGYLPAEFQSNPFLWIDMVHPEDRQAVMNYIEQIISSERLSPIEHRILNKDGAMRWVRNTIVQHRAHSGSVDGYDGLVEDITERKSVEAELQQTLAELERRVLQRTAALTQTNLALQDELAERQRAEERLRVAMERLDVLDKAKMQFVSNISHEIKLPVVSLRYAVENMLKGITGPLSEQQIKYVTLMKNGVERILHTTQEILDVGRLEAKTLVLQCTREPVADFVRRAVALLTIDAEKKPVTLSLFLDDVRETIEWDVEKMERSLHNIVENAIKYTPAGGTVEVALRKDPARPDFLTLTVTDNGAGIRPEHQCRIMERYYRTNESIPGVGLGLSICRDIVRLHGGEIFLSSPPPGRERGTEVTLRLPIMAQAGPI